MNPTHSFSSPLGEGRVDEANGVIHGVSVITAGPARGHSLLVDDTTLGQVLACARAKKTVPVKIGHDGGAAGIVGYIDNFRREGQKIVGDFSVLSAHPARNQILETARRMPTGVGLSVSFVSPENPEPGKARCADLLSVDWVANPAANASLFSARTEARERPLSGTERVRRAISAAGRGAALGGEVGVVGGIASRLLLKRRGIRPDVAATAGAAVGAIASAAHQWRRDARPRDLAARVQTILFQDRRAALARLLDATRENVSVPVPGADEAGTVATVAKKPIVRRIGTRLLKIGAGAGLGHYAGRYAGRRLGEKAGAVAGALSGAVAGALFSSPEVRNTVRLSLARAAKVTNL